MYCVKLKTLIFVLILLLAITQEGEGRRKILKGRKAITRTYYRYTAIPAWAIVLLVALAELLFGGMLFLILKVLILDPPIKPSYMRVLISPSSTP